MSFAFPGFLFALFAIAIPVIIHLFRFRRFRTVYFPNVAFLQQLSETSKRESRLKNLLVLLARILAIVFLVMAFARPYIPADTEDIAPEGNAVGVYLDNSFSMNALSGQGRLLDEARSRALEIADLYEPTDRFLLLTNDFKGQHQRFVSRQEFMEMVRQVDETARVRTIAEVMRRKEELFAGEPSDHQRAYYLSDFQKSTTELADVDQEHEVPAYLVPVQTRQTDNVFIDSCWFETPAHLAGEPVTMHVRIRNDGTRDLENQPLRLYVEGAQRTIMSFNIDEGSEEVLELTWSAGEKPLQQGYVEITDHPVTFDDRMYFSYHVSSEIPVLGLEGDGRNQYLHALFDSDDLFDYETVPGFSIDYSKFADHNLIVMTGFSNVSAGLSNELQRFVSNGGSLVIFPGEDIDISSYNRLLQNLQLDRYEHLDTNEVSVSSINELHQVFEGVFEEIPEHVDLPTASMYYPVSRHVGSSGEDLLQLQNGLPFFSSYPLGDGQVFLSAVGLDHSFGNFQRHSIFVPVMANIAIQSGSTQPLYYTIGEGEPVEPGVRGVQPDQVFVLRKDDFEVIPEQRRMHNRIQLFFHDQIKEAHNYDLHLGDDQIGGLSFNYDRRESLLDVYDEGELETLLADLQMASAQVVDVGTSPLETAFQEMGMSRQLWQYFILLALICILAEILMLRFWK